MIWFAAFILFFGGGPLLFRALTHHRASRAGLRKLAVLTVLFAVSGTAVRYGAAYLPTQQVWPTLTSIIAMWLAWISALAFGTQALRRSDRSLRMKRWSGVIGALGTTIPWFGLASANMVWG